MRIGCEHHTESVAGAGFAAAVLCAWLAPRLLRWMLPVALLATALSAASRLVLGVHWFTDTVGSVLGVLGAGLLATVALRLLPAAPTSHPSSGRTDAQAA